MVAPEPTFTSPSAVRLTLPVLDLALVVTETSPPVPMTVTSSSAVIEPTVAVLPETVM